MAPRPTLSALEAQLEQRWRRRTIMRRTLLTMIILGLLLLLWPWSCDDTVPSQERLTPIKPREPHSSQLGGGGRLIRPTLESATAVTVPWGRQLSDTLKTFGPGLESCFDQATKLEWTFAYQPASGSIKHHSFLAEDGQAPNEETSVCLLSTLPTLVPLEGTQPQTWFTVRMILLSPGQPEGQPLEPFSAATAKPEP